MLRSINATLKDPATRTSDEEAKERILTVDEKTTRNANKSITKTVWNNHYIHLRNTERRRHGHDGTTSSISTAGEFKPVKVAYLGLVLS
jgi:hypothetical protein